MSVIPRLVAALCTAKVVTLAMPVAAQGSHSFLESDNILYAGVFDQSLDAKLSAPREGFPIDTIRLRDIGVESDDRSWLLDYRHRFSSQWSLSASAYAFRNSGAKVLERSFNFDGQVFTAGFDSRALLEVDTYIASLMYTAYRSDSSEIDIGAGIHAFDTRAEIRATGLLDGDETPSSSFGNAELLAPLPNFRFSAFHAFNRKVSVMATLGWLSANIDDYDGSFAYGHLRGAYQLTDRLGFVLGYQHVDVDIERQRSNGSDSFDFVFEGWTAALSYAF